MSIKIENLGDDLINGNVVRRQNGQATYCPDTSTIERDITYAQAYEDGLVAGLPTIAIGEMVEAHNNRVVNNPLMPSDEPTSFVQPGDTIIPWVSGDQAWVGTQYSDAGLTYICIQDPLTNLNPPSAVPALYTIIRYPGDPWVQPLSTEAYRMSSLVTHNGFTWVSRHDANVWEPGTVNDSIWEQTT